MFLKFGDLHLMNSNNNLLGVMIRRLEKNNLLQKNCWVAQTKETNKHKQILNVKLWIFLFMGGRFFYLNI